MTTNRNGPGPALEQARTALHDIGWNYPPWYTWAGVGGILYARHPRSSPPIIVRSPTAEGLCVEIEKAERKRGSR